MKFCYTKLNSHPTWYISSQILSLGCESDQSKSHPSIYHVRLLSILTFYNKYPKVQTRVKQCEMHSKSSAYLLLKTFCCPKQYDCCSQCQVYSSWQLQYEGHGHVLETAFPLRISFQWKWNWGVSAPILPTRLKSCSQNQGSSRGSVSLKNALGRTINQREKYTTKEELLKYGTKVENILESEERHVHLVFRNMFFHSKTEVTFEIYFIMKWGNVIPWLQIPV
jgi:hypothetical protein